MPSDGEFADLRFGVYAPREKKLKSLRSSIWSEAYITPTKLL